MKRTLFLLLAMLFANLLLAQLPQNSFLVGQLYYVTTSENEVSVCGYNNADSPTDLVIPSTVTFQGTTYKLLLLEIERFYIME